MSRSIQILFLLFMMGVLCACQGNKTHEIPASEFFNPPVKSAFKISPDGKYISYLKKYKLKQNLFIQTLADGKERMATTFSDFAVRGDYSWTFDNQIVFSLDGTPHDAYLMFALDVNTLQKRPLLSEEKISVRMLGRNKFTPDIITIAMNKRDSANYDVYRLNIKNGELQPYLVNPGNITKWVLDLDGKIRLAKASDGVDETILYRPSDNVPFKAIIKNNFRNSVEPIAFTGIRNNFYALSNVGRDKTAFVEINAENGKEERMIFASDSADIQRVDYSKNKRRLELAAWEVDKPKKHFLNEGIKEIYDNLAKQLGDNEINIADRDTAENKFIVTTFTDRSRGAVYLYEREEDKLTKLTDNSSLNPDELCPMQPIHYKASDGMIINGYLTLPLGQAKTNLAVIVMPHDGPFGARNSWGYSSEVQFLANRGFAVLQVNYRGSSGYGKAFYSAGFKEVGGKIQQDITDGVNWLIATKVANPKKIAIYGRGFGGFSALYGVSFNPHLYNCAVVQNGWISIFTYIQTAPAVYKPFLQKMYATIGDTEKDAALLTAISPALHPEKPVVPLFIFQDANYKRGNLEDLNLYVRKLQKRNVQVKYSVNKNERGSVGSEKMRMQYYADIEKFLDNNMRIKP